MTVSNNTEMKQVKLIIEDIGSVIKSSKKRITWTFSIGQEEHSVGLQWNKTFGKRQVIDGDFWDGVFVYEETKKGNFFFYKFDSYRAGVPIHIIASSHTPAKDKLLCDNFCKYELIVNGLPFSRLPRHDGTPLPPLEGPGPYGIFDIIYPQGYDINFTKEAPFHKKEHFDSVAFERIEESAPLTVQ